MQGLFKLSEGKSCNAYYAHLWKGNLAVPVNNNIPLSFNVAPDCYPQLVSRPQDIIGTHRHPVSRGKGRRWLPEKVIPELANVRGYCAAGSTGNKLLKL